MNDETPDYLKYIKLGTNCKEWFNYDGQGLPIRPLSTYEHDEALLKAIREGISQTTFNAVIKAKLNIVKPEEKINATISDYAEFVKYFNEIDYWIVYYSMKDFQPEEFSKPDFSKEFKKDFKDWSIDLPKGYYIVKKMKYVHQIADDIRLMTDAPVTEFIQVLKNNAGKNLASIVYTTHVPLTSEAWKLTPLQEKFLTYSAPGMPEILKDESDLPGITSGMTMREVMNKLTGGWLDEHANRVD